MASQATNTGPKHPEVRVQLSGEDGNAFAIIGRVSSALRRAGHRESAQEIKNKLMECEDHDSVLRLAMEYVEVS